MRSSWLWWTVLTAGAGLSGVGFTSCVAGQYTAGAVTLVAGLVVGGAAGYALRRMEPYERAGPVSVTTPIALGVGLAVFRYFDLQGRPVAGWAAMMVISLATAFVTRYVRRRA